ncbi:Inner membrane transport permease ybhR [Candidatus Ornithobacterium hominis]|uniref:ABC transporter permease n=1 Tax=Candidatus Ornithobacterium hominis TaxID=2497989 RepID=UPI000E5A6C1A|nr:ABC transporter permease [Candidatus Ornithobacterium hominis]SZD73368.1 Inner membrane transport permease ybhR [Candidatus Ornithobacterium hominis]
MKQFLYLIKREFKLFLKNETLRNVFLLAPLAYALIIGFTYQQGKTENLPVIVINHDLSPLSFQVVEMLQDNKNIEVLEYQLEPASIKNEVIKTEAAAVVVIPERFEAHMLQKKYPEINVYVNTSNILTANFASKAIQLVLATFSAGAEIKSIQRKGMNAEIAKMNYEPFKTNYITLFNTSSNYLIFMWPAMMAVVLQQVILLAMAISFSEEFKRDSFIQDFTGKYQYTALVMVIKNLPIWTFSLVNLLVFYGIGKFFMIPMPQNLLYFAITTVLFIVACGNLGVMVSILLPDALKITQILMVIASPAFLISGYTWPRSAMPVFVQAITDIIPLTPYLEAMKILFIQNGESVLTHPYIIHLLILGWIYFLIGWLALKIKIFRLVRALKN